MDFVTGETQEHLDEGAAVAIGVIALEAEGKQIASRRDRVPVDQKDPMRQALGGVQPDEVVVLPSGKARGQAEQGQGERAEQSDQ